MQKNVRRIITLLICLFILVGCEMTSINKYIGIYKVSSWMKKDFNFYQISKLFYGKELDVFYENEIKVNSFIVDMKYVDDTCFVYQNIDSLYLSEFGVVNKIKRVEESYEVTIIHQKKIVTYGGFNEVCVRIYDKIDAETLIGYLDYFEVGYMYYFYENKMAY